MSVGTACASSNKASVKTGEPETGKKEVVASDEDETPGIQFYHGTWKEALAKAKAENKYIFLDAYTVWCSPCIRMASRTFTQERVGKYYNANFINVKMDMERGVGPSFSRKYEVTNYPTLFIIDGDGKVVARIIGALSAGELLSFGKRHAK